VSAIGLVVATVTALAGCGQQAEGPPNLVWYTNPDSGGQEEIAARCTAASGGQYTISVSVLPRESSERTTPRST
jgi:multiple sugar transport system substrate-binding protein